MDSQRGFSLLETMAALGIVSLLLLAGLRLATLARAPGATANAAAQLDAAIALARSLARASGNGATLLLLPRRDAHGDPMPGFRIVLYRGRPNVAGAATLARELPLVADASLREAHLGAPPLALFFRRDGTAVGSAHPALAGAASTPQFAPIAAEPPCPSAVGIALQIARNGAMVTRAIPCPAAPNATVAAPQPSMTPNPPTVAPHALLFHWPSAPEEWFAIAEFGYRRWFAATGGAMRGFACVDGGAAVVAFPSVPPYSGPQSAADAQSSPAPPNAPYAYAVATSTAPGAMDDAPAHFPVRPVGAGLCSVPLVDAFAQHADPWGNPLVVTMQVMGWLTLSQGSRSATSQSAPLAAGSLARGQSLTIAASKRFDNDPAGIVFSGVSWNHASCGNALTFTTSNNNTAGVGATGTATHGFLIADNNAPASALTCTGSVSDRYGEPAVAFTVNVAAGSSAFLTWPAGGIVEATSGSTLAMLPMREPLIAQVLGAKIADAMTAGCKAIAIQSGIYPTAYVAATMTGLPAGVQSLLAGQGWSVDSTGCVLQNGAPASSAPIVAYVPGSTSTTTPTYQDSAGTCSNIAALGQASPLNASGVPSGAQIDVPVIPGTTSGNCTVLITAASASPAPGSGSVVVQTISACATTADNCLYIGMNDAAPNFFGSPPGNPGEYGWGAAFTWNGNTWVEQMAAEYNPPYQNCSTKIVLGNPITTCSTTAPASTEFVVPTVSGTIYTLGATGIPSDIQAAYNAYSGGAYRYQIEYGCTSSNGVDGVGGPTYPTTPPSSINGLPTITAGITGVGLCEQNLVGL